LGTVQGNDKEVSTPWTRVAPTDYDSVQRVELITRQLVDTTAGGSLGDKTAEEAKELLENLALNDYKYPST
jgi:hypothetical protein